MDKADAAMPMAKPWWEITPEEAASCLEHTLWCPSDTGYFPGGGWSTDFTTRGGMACTTSRINLVKGLGAVLQIAERLRVATRSGRLARNAVRGIRENGHNRLP